MTTIRKNARIKDVIIGMAGSGSRGLKHIHPQLIYWMQVEETLTFDQYWNDQRFARKKPRIPGPKLWVVGDNTYRHEPDSDSWAFAPSMHYIPGANHNHERHVKIDTSIDRILLSRRYTYWGKDGPAVPDHLIGLFPKTRNYKCNHPDPELVDELHELISLDEPRYVAGEPADWDNPRYFEKG